MEVRKPTTLCAGAAASSQLTFQAADPKISTASEVAIHLFKKYVYNPTAIVIGYPLFYGKQTIIECFNAAFMEGRKPLTWYTYFNHNSNDPAFNLLKQGKALLNFKELFLTIQQDASMIGFKKYNCFIAQAITNISELVTQAVHKIFNYFLPCYLNPAHLLSFFMSIQQSLLQFPMNTFSEGATFLGYQQDYLYQAL
jgi:hypothetical protein